MKWLCTLINQMHHSETRLRYAGLLIACSLMIVGLTYTILTPYVSAPPPAREFAESPVVVTLPSAASVDSVDIRLGPSVQWFNGSSRMDASSRRLSDSNTIFDLHIRFSRLAIFDALTVQTPSGGKVLFMEVGTSVAPPPGVASSVAGEACVGPAALQHGSACLIQDHSSIRRIAKGVGPLLGESEASTLRLPSSVEGPRTVDEIRVSIQVEGVVKSVGDDAYLRPPSVAIIVPRNPGLVAEGDQRTVYPLPGPDNSSLIYMAEVPGATLVNWTLPLPPSVSIDDPPRPVAEDLQVGGSAVGWESSDDFPVRLAGGVLTGDGSAVYLAQFPSVDLNLSTKSGSKELVVLLSGLALGFAGALIVEGFFGTVRNGKSMGPNVVLPDARRDASESTQDTRSQVGSLRSGACLIVAVWVAAEGLRRLVSRWRGD